MAEKERGGMNMSELTYMPFKQHPFSLKVNCNSEGTLEEFEKWIFQRASKFPDTA